MPPPPADRFYIPTHQWARELAPGRVEIGITAFAQDALGDVVFADLPKPGAVLVAGEPFMVIESVKTASDVHAPVAGTVVEVNEALRDSPESLNADPYGAWLVRVEAAPDALATTGLLDSAAYAAVMG
ncbi:MAG: glycine cleavage system protein GcvH [Rhodocyclaceae bacterium]|nr:glycine cleavage system protein GcvH [Rhodocyclaceae bacterium]MCA3075173.1 glycine cleavage system protein GcvH [Rhodocyclaceae bacterium]MCA3091135.1 glycine cleavage system protein GcvH [Rhodocyclaceae bacterium]MCA3092297.1 glycine cleavage system protein GcvH [Rhodocyclaceae bacterium]MCA3098500.1 glycine cleavage system protein GcvH [Rhodocyclaceae bacterium]